MNRGAKSRGWSVLLAGALAAGTAAAGGAEASGAAQGAPGATAGPQGQAPGGPKGAAIARQWRGKTTAANADAYERYLGEGVKKFPTIPGNRGYQLFREDDGQVVHFSVISWWDSKASIHGYAGADIQRTRDLPRDKEFLIDPEPTVHNYELRVDAIHGAHGASRAGAQPGAGVEEAKRTLIAQADAWDKAIVRKDRPAIEANVGPGFFHISADGSREEREAFIAGLVDPALTLDPYVVEDLTVQVIGDTALLSGTTKMTGRYAGKPFTSHYRYIDTYVRQGGKWQVAAVQITKIAPPR